MSASNQTLLIETDSELPEGWMCPLLSEVCEINPRKVAFDSLEPNQPVTFVPMAAVDAYKGAITAADERPFSEVRKGFTSFQDDDVIMAKITPCMENGKAALVRGLVNGLGFGSTEFHVLRSRGAVLSEFVYHFVRQESFRKVAEAEMTGSVGQKRVPVTFLEETKLPLPPLAEQNRIVERVGKLLASVNTTQRRLTNTSEILQKLRNALLDAAITGNLTMGWRKKTRAMATAKDDLKEVVPSIDGLPRRLRQLEMSEGHEALTEAVPVEWETPLLGNLFRFIDYRGKNPPKSSYGKRLIGAKNIKMGYLSEYPVEYVSDKTYESWMTRGFPRKGDILFVTEGHTMGFAALNDREDEFALAQRTITLQPWQPFDIRCFLYFIMSPLFQQVIRLNATGSAAVGIKGARLQCLPIAFPPFAEQQAIVKILETLFALTGEIKKQITAATAYSDKLTQSILAKAFRGELIPTEAELARREGRSYESAADLLARIRSGLAAQGNPTKPHTMKRDTQRQIKMRDV